MLVSWNGGEALERCVASLLGQGIFRLVIVDNASDPTQRARLEKLYGNTPDIELVLLDENRGFAGGGNAGIEAGLDAGADAILVVTQDVVLDPDAVGILTEALRQSDAGIVGPRVVDEHTGVELSRGESIIPELICVPRSWLRPRRAGSDPRQVDGVMGCLMLLRADCARATGGFDEAFFAYYEEVDLCLRARAAGFRIVCAPGARITHDGMRGFLAGFTPLAAELKARNLVWLMRKHGTWLAWATFLPTYLALLASSALLYLLRGAPQIAAAMGRGAVRGFTQGPSAVPH